MTLNPKSFSAPRQPGGWRCVGLRDREREPWQAEVAWWFLHQLLPYALPALRVVLGLRKKVREAQGWGA